MEHRTIAREASSTLEISRSRFVAVAFSIGGLDDLAARVEQERRAHRDARHVCSAGVAGSHADASRSSDDGEPAGTAGMPILTAISRASLTDVGVIVVRWFGGVKLGAGGLLRAYSGVATSAIAAAGVIVRTPGHVVEARLDPADAPRIEHAVRAAGFVPTVAYGEAPTLTVRVTTIERARLDALLAPLGVAARAVSDAWIDA